MTEIVHMDAEGPVEVRSMEKRLIAGRIVPFNETIQVRGRKESFVKGSFEGLSAKETVLLYSHDQAKPIGRMNALEERDDGVYATFKVAKTLLGDEVLQLTAEGVVDSFSVGFVPDKQTADGIHRRIKSLPEVSLVTFGAYSDAKVLSVRNTTDKEENMSENTEKVETEEVEKVETREETPELETRLNDFETELAKLKTIAIHPEKETELPEVTPFDWFVGEVHAQVLGNTETREKIQENLEKRAVADAVGYWGGSSDASGLTMNDYLADQFVNVLDARRPFFAAAGKMPMPHSGSALIPKVSQHTTVTVRGTQAAEPGSQALQVDTTAYTAKWYSGALQVSLELIQTAEIGALQLVWGDLLGRFAAVTETAAITDLEAAITVYGDALGTGTYAAFALDIAQQAQVVRAATGLPATKLAVPTAVFPTLIAMVDGFDRRQFTAGDWSDSTNHFNSESFALPGGIEVFAAAVTKSILFNEAAFVTADSGITKVEATNVAQITRDVGIIGRTMIVPRIPGGIVYFDASPSS